MKRKRIRLTYKKERAIRSDVLPYELPLTFSNYHFYEFLLANNVEFRDGNIYWKQGDAALDATIRLLIGADNTVQVETRKEYIHGENVLVNNFKGLDSKFFGSIPFGYKIQHKEDEFRELAICHPRNQIQLVDLYHRYKELILYYCNRSPFSIRRPARLSRFVFYKDKTHYRKLTGEPVGVELSEREYENLRSFFAYEKYNFIYKFHESPEFHRCEKKYNKLLNLDISKCFGSIYTHSIAWALLGRESVKENRGESQKTFAGQFDKFMRQANYDETNGIIIGPEFSRIFAELILQSADRALFLELKRKGFAHKVDYEIFRYVDDYFVFYNEENAKSAIVELLQLKLKDYRLYLNKAKAVDYSKPIITNISIAKQRIKELLGGSIAYKMEMEDPSAKIQEGGTAQKNGSIHINSSRLITKFKTIIKEAEVEYRDTLNYALSIVEGTSTQVIKDYDLITKLDGSDKQLGQAILAICEFSFFIYSVSPRVNTTIKLCRILRLFISFLKKKGTDQDIKHSVFKLIFDDIYLILKKYKHREHTPVETMYLLIVLSELGRDYWLDANVLSSHLDIKDGGNKGSPKGPPLNYICLVVLLFYMKRKKRYDDLRSLVESKIIQKFQEKKATLRKDTELTLLLLDSLTCPYLKPATKEALLRTYGIDDPAMQQAIIGKRRYWFTKWSEFDFGRELDDKLSLEVY